MTDDSFEQPLAKWARSVNLALFFAETVYQKTYVTAWGRRWVQADVFCEWDSVSGRWVTEFTEALS